MFLFLFKLETGACFECQSSNGTMEALAPVIAVLSLSLTLLGGGEGTL